MTRHVSLFRLKPEFRREEIVQMLAAALRALPEQVPEIVACEIGIKAAGAPDRSPDGAVEFYDLIQIITFATPEACAAYPATRGHLDFLRQSAPYMETVKAIDYEI